MVLQLGSPLRSVSPPAFFALHSLSEVSFLFRGFLWLRFVSSGSLPRSFLLLMRRFPMPSRQSSVASGPSCYAFGSLWASRILLRRLFQDLVGDTSGLPSYPPRASCPPPGPWTLSHLQRRPETVASLEATTGLPTSNPSSLFSVPFGSWGQSKKTP